MKRDILWSYSKPTSRLIGEDTWVCLGDFSTYLSKNEKLGVRESMREP